MYFDDIKEEKDPIDSFESYFSNRRRQLQDWEAHPPHRFGWLVFGLTIVEFVLAKRLFFGLGIDLSIIGEMIGLALVFLIAEGFMVKVADEVSHYFNKKGSWTKTFTFFNIGLLPFLLFLPITFLFWSMDGSGVIRVLIFLVLVSRVLSNWKESIEVTHELSRLQSALVIYATIGAGFSLLIILGYLSAIQSVLSVFSAFN